MSQPSNQEHGRKKRRGRKVVDENQPSRAPRQDEDTQPARDVDRSSSHAPPATSSQGISNRPADEEHAFPPADQPRSEDPRDRSPDVPDQQGGNRGGV
jgi:hypothetical protein